MNKARIFLIPFLAMSIGSLSGCEKKHGHYDVYWKNWDGSILEIDPGVEEESTPEFNGETPLRAQSDSTIYEFDCWEPAVGPVSGETSYTAKFKETPRPYKVTWLNYNDDLLLEEEVPYGTTPSYSGDIPTRDSTLSTDYTFSGWDRKIEPVTGNMTYKATFSDEVHDLVKIIYNFDKTLAHEVINDNTTLEREGTDVLLAEPTCAGYDFDGWYLDEGYTKQVASLPNLSIDVVLYGKFNIHTYNIVYDLKEGELATPNPTEMTCLDEATLSNPTKTGYEFEYWQDAYGNKYTELKDVCQDIALTAVYKANQYTITLKYSEKDDEYIDINYGDPVIINNPSKDGYEFLGWFYQNDPTQKFDLETYTLLSDVVLVQKWSDPITYYIKYNVVGGDAITNPDHYTIIDQPELPTPTRFGYDFGGWVDENGNKFENFTGVFRDVELTALWIPHNVSISFDYDGGSLQRKVEFYNGTSVVRESAISPFESVEFEFLDDTSTAQFDGWVTEDGDRVSFASDAVIDSDLKLKAKWVSVSDKDVASHVNVDNTFVVDGFNYKIYQYTPLVSQKVVFESEGELDVKAKLFAYGNLEKVLAEDDDSGEAKNFSFSYDLQAYSTYWLKVESQTENTGSVTIKATSDVENQVPAGKISSAVYRIESSTQKFGELFKSVGEPVKEGKVFAGWFDEDNMQYTATSELAKHDIVLKARWDDVV